MIRVKLTLSLTPLGAVEDFARDLPRFVREDGRGIIGELSGPLLMELRRYPAPPNYEYGKFPWKSKKQRRKVMAMLHGRRYERTFGQRDAWVVRPDVKDGRLVMSVSNDADSTQFTQGRLNQKQRAEALKPIQPFHAPRWPIAVDIIQPYFEKAETLVTAAAILRFDDALKVKATRRSSFR